MKFTSLFDYKMNIMVFIQQYESEVKFRYRVDIAKYPSQLSLNNLFFNTAPRSKESDIHRTSKNAKDIRKRTNRMRLRSSHRSASGVSFSLVALQAANRAIITAPAS